MCIICVFFLKSFYRKRFGDRVELLSDSKEVEAKQLEPGRAYLQVSERKLAYPCFIYRYLLFLVYAFSSLYVSISVILFFFLLQFYAFFTLFHLLLPWSWLAWLSFLLCQVTYVEPYFNEHELKRRGKFFEQNMNVKHFVYVGATGPESAATEKGLTL